MCIVGIVVPTKQDIESISPCFNILEDLKISYKIDVIPSVDLLKLVNYSLTVKSEGFKVIISASRGSPSSSSIISVNTTLPVIGIPLESNLNGIDSLFACLKASLGFPVATMSAGKEGAQNAALFAAAILSLLDKKDEDDLEKRYEDYKYKISKE